MLKFMRKYQRSWVIKVIFGAIIVSFVLFFGYGALSDKEKSIAQVGPYKVSYREFQETYDKQRDFYKMLTKNDLDEKTLKDLKQKVIEGLVDKYVLLVK